MAPAAASPVATADSADRGGQRLVLLGGAQHRLQEALEAAALAGEGGEGEPGHQGQQRPSTIRGTVMTGGDSCGWRPSGQRRSPKKVRNTYRDM